MDKREKRIRRHKRVRAKVRGTEKRPRLCVFRSNKHIYAQIIDDEKGITLVSASDQEIKKKDLEAVSKNFKGKCLLAFLVGKLVAKKAQKKKIEKVVFDRAGYRYHGRVKALAEGAREQGLKF